MEESLIRQLVWLDFRLAVLFALCLPLGLLIWAFRAKREPIKRSLIIYWRVASLLAITVYLMIGSLPISFLTGLAAKILIPLSLWFWQDLNEDIDTSKGLITTCYKAWRWAMTTYYSLSALIGLSFANCAFANAEQLSNACKIWFEPSWAFKAMFHDGLPTANLVFFGIICLVIYCLYFGSFVVFGLPKQGRIAFRE